MRNVDEQIDQVLAGLRNVETPAGLERRTLLAVQARAAMKPERVRWSAGPWVWGSAFASLAALCMVITTLHHARQISVVSTMRPQPSPMKLSDETVPQASVERLPRIIAVGGRSEGHRRAQAPALGQSPSGEVQPVSYPAPPMPLTEQEKLLLRVVHKGDPVQLAMLDPVQRSAQDARGRAEFQNFFEPQTTGETK